MTTRSTSLAVPPGLINYGSEYRNVGGIIVPTKRRVYAYEGDYQLVKEPLLVAIDTGEITFLYVARVPDRVMVDLRHTR
jgi:hypothetical protein